MVQSNRVIHECKIEIVNTEGKVVCDYRMKNQYVSGFPLRLDKGKYLVRIRSETGKKEKQIFIS